MPPGSDAMTLLPSRVSIGIEKPAWRYRTHNVREVEHRNRVSQDQREHTTSESEAEPPTRNRAGMHPATYEGADSITRENDRCTDVHAEAAHDHSPVSACSSVMMTVQMRLLSSLENLAWGLVLITNTISAARERGPWGAVQANGRVTETT